MSKCNMTDCTVETKSAYYCARHAAEVKRIERRGVAKYLLGGKCVGCGSKKRLEFDHIDPSTKMFNISESAGRTMESFLEEVDKCQLLCHPCHVEKSVGERVEQTWDTRQSGGLDIDIDAINRIKF